MLSKIKTLVIPIVFTSLYSWSAYAADHALIVGVGEFKDPQVTSLPGIQLDVDMAQQMMRHLGVPSQNIKILRDKQATIEGMRQQLKWLAKNVSQDDHIFIYFSGHGSQVEDKNGDEEDGLDETLYLYDGHLIDDEFGELLKNIPSQNVVVLVDACHSGTGTKSLANNRYAATQGQVKSWRDSKTPYRPASRKSLAVEAIEQKSDNYVAMAAAQDNQSAIATPSGSIFTKALLDSFESSRTSANPVTWQELFQKTKANVAEVNQTFVPNLDGNTDLANKAIRFAKVSQEEHRVVWQEVVNVVSRAGSKLNITAPEQLKEGDLLSMSIEVPQDGYLNVLSIGPDDVATVLFPNPHITNNQVKAGTTIRVPAGFNIRAVPPLGKTLVAAFVTTEPMDFQKTAMGNRNAKGELSKAFGVQTLAGVRSLSRQKDNAAKASYSAGYREINITAK